MFAAGKTAAVSGAAPDAQFNYVTMLLHGDGTNGAQNNTFVDSSTNNFTITRNGNTTQGTFSPYGSNWGINNGSANGNGFQFSGTTLTGDFTMEAWVFATPHPSTQSIVFSYSSGNVQMIYFYPDGRFGWYRSTGSGVTAAGVFTYNTWNHVAAVRSSGVIKLYLNGVDVGLSISDSSSVTVDSLLGYGGSGATTYNVLGYVSNARVTDTVVYSGNFTPSTTPLTAISGTRLLTFQSNRFIDNSSNNFAFTIAGTPSVQRFNPFGASTAYSTSVIGGSGYFDGSGDTLTTSTSQIIPTGSFTVECWAYVTGTGANQKFVAQGSSGAAGRFSLGIEGSNWWVQLGGDAIQTGTPVKNQWNYVAVTYNGSTITLYVNGTSIGTVSSTANAQNTTLTIGQDWNSYIVTGYVADVRISNTVRTITTPTAPYSSDGSTRLLLSMTNGAIYDNAMMNDLETVGNAQISTSVVKYGTGSISLSASGNTLRTQYNNPSLSMGTGNFTIEGWVYFSSTPSINGVFQMSGTSGGFATNQTANLALTTNDASSWQIYAKNTYTISSSTTIAVGSWIHFALVRNGTTTVLYINGSALITLTSDSTDYNTPYIGVGSIYNSSSYPLNGYLDDLRITKGYARYTANFTPPTAAFPNTGPI